MKAILQKPQLLACGRDDRSYQTIGDPGEHGTDAPGEVSAQQFNDAMNNAIAGTSANSNSVGTLDLTVSDPPTQSEVQSVVDKLNELINALRR